MKTHTRVLVIGGGVVGCSVLYHLTKLGWSDVTLIERSDLTSGSTWHAAGGFHTLNGDPNVAMLQSYTVSLYQELERISGQSCGMHKSPGIMLADTPERMEFLNMSVAESTHADFMPAQFDVVTALHACDTATDDAIAFGLEKKAKAMVLVPCCQAEVAACLRQTKALSLTRTPLAELWRHPIHTREMGSQLTNVLRCLYLEACGYQVTVTELVGWEHSMKNELIIARYTGQKKRSAVERMRAILAEFGLQDAMAQRYPLLQAA